MNLSPGRGLGVRAEKLEDVRHANMAAASMGKPRRGSTAMRVAVQSDTVNLE
jgi:hypothetical protein